MFDWKYILYIIIYLAIAAALAIIPANIAEVKGYRFAVWWLYGFLLWPFATIHIACLPNKNAIKVIIDALGHERKPFDAANEIDKYNELYEQGVISGEEFEKKRKQLLTIN